MQTLAPSCSFTHLFFSTVFPSLHILYVYFFCLFALSPCIGSGSAGLRLEKCLLDELDVLMSWLKEIQ